MSASAGAGVGSSAASEGFCAAAWRHTAALQQEIVDHPFNRALAAGSLPMPRFQFYLVQDSRYLVGFAQALAVASSRADCPADAAFYATSAQTALLAERSLHSSYLAGFAADTVPTAPSALAYVSYLHSVALTGSYAELVAVVLPCYWVYAHVGTRIAQQVPDTARHPYGRWIATYADEGFAASVRTAQAIADRLAESANAATRAGMLARFVRGCEYEWMFWDAAWHGESWPTAAMVPQ